MLGRLEAIWIKRAKRGPMDAVPCAQLQRDRGIAGNANRGGRRQVTIISLERWRELMDTLGADLAPSTRRANFMISGLSLERSRGRVLRIGAARLRINGETRPCEQMEAAHPGLQQAMQSRWGGGAYAEVLEDADVCVGDAVDWDLPLLD